MAFPTIVAIENVYAPYDPYKLALGLGILLDLHSASYIPKNNLDPALKGMNETLLNIGIDVFFDFPLLFNSDIFNLNMNAGFALLLSATGVNEQTDKDIKFKKINGKFKGSPFSNWGIKIGLEGSTPKLKRHKSIFFQDRFLFFKRCILTYVYNSTLPKNSAS